MKISIYGHGGSANHGNEAIVRGIYKLLHNEKITLYSFLPDVDIKFGLDKICNIQPMINYNRFTLKHVTIALLFRLTKSSKLTYPKHYFNKFLNNIEGIYLLEAGDQYCENDNLRKLYAYLNDEINKKGGRTVLLGCTIDPELLKNKNLVKDLKKYSLIVARESITYEALLNAGITKNTKLAPCPAFLMDYEKCKLPKIFKGRDVIGINIGFLSQGNESFYDLLIRNCEELIEFIILETNFNIALIPHVNWDAEQSDFKTLNLLYGKYNYSNRIEVVEEHNASKQKYIMSKCRYMVALRTHVCVPSIASLVPTLVTGYKVKSTGIVKDIFPDDYKLLLHVQSLKSERDFINHFIWMQNNENAIREYMKEKVPRYIENADLIYEEIKALNAK